MRRTICFKENIAKIIIRKSILFKLILSIKKGVFIKFLLLFVIKSLSVKNVNLSGYYEIKRTDID
jgi:hypothetical protein